MVVDDHDDVDAPCLPVLGDVREVTGVCLPNFAEFILLVGLAVTQVRIPGGFQVIVPDETLDGINTDRSVNKGIAYKCI